MPDIHAAAAVASSATAAAASSGSNNIVIEVAVNTVPDKILQLARQIEVSGTLAQPPADNTITLNTAIGPLVLVLPQLAQAQQDKLIQQLLTLFQGQRPLAVVLQPGNPPVQAFLSLLPVNTATSNASGAANFFQPPAVTQAAPPLAPNAPLSAVVLPNNITLPSAAPAGPGFGSNPNPDFSFGSNPNSGFGAGGNPPVLNPPADLSTGLPVGNPAANLPPIELPDTVVAGEALAQPEEQALPNLMPPPAAPAFQNLASPANAFSPSLTGTAPSANAVASPPNAVTSPANAAASPPNTFTSPANASALPSAMSALPSDAPAPSSSTGMTALLQPGTELTIRINAAIPPSAPGAASIPSPASQTVSQIGDQTGNQIAATVTGNGPGGQLILKAGDATIFVRQPVNLPVGTQLELTIEPAQTTGPAFFTVSDQPQFTALQQVLAALTQMNPAMAQAIMSGRMPQPGDGLPGGLLFFLSAIREGDVRGWLGNGALDLLTQAGKTQLIVKLAQEMQQAVQPARDNVVGEWRSYPVPVHDNNQLGVLYFHVHGDRQHHALGRDGKSKKIGPTQIRFLIDVRMSRLGALQLDGFLRPKQLDIIIRSENPLPPGLSQDLRHSYVRTLSAIGYNGALNFQNGRQGWLNIRKPAAGAAITT